MIPSLLQCETRAARAMRGTMPLDAASAIGHPSTSRDSRLVIRKVRPSAFPLKRASIDWQPRWTAALSHWATA